MNAPDDKPMSRWPGRFERLAVPAVICLLLSGVAVPVAVHRLSTRRSDDPASQPAAEAGAYGQIRAVVLELHSADARQPYEQHLRNIAASGAQAVCLSIPAWQDDANASSLFIEYRRIPREDRIERLIRLARELKLTVVVMPVLLLDEPDEGQWPGGIEPAQAYAWWEDYENFVMFCAYLAARAEADALAIGSQLLSLQAQQNRWRALLGRVRQAFSGKLCYIAHRGAYRDINWWSDLDWFGVAVPFGLDGEGRSTFQRQLNSPVPAGPDVPEFQQRLRRPVLYALTGPPEAILPAATTTSTRTSQQP